MPCDRWYTDRLGRQQLELEQRRVNELQEQINMKEAELRQASGDLDRQMRINRELEADVRQLRRLVARLDETRLDIQNMGEKERQQLRSQLTDTNVDVSGLERELEEHIAEVLKRTGEERARVSTELKKHERMVEETGKKITEKIQQVEARHRREIQDRLDGEASIAARLSAQTKVISELLEEEKNLEFLELRRERNSIRIMLDVAGKLCESENYQAALASGENAASECHALLTEARQRRAELASGKATTLTRLQYLSALLEDDGLKACFHPEKIGFDRKIEAMQRRAQDGFKSYSALPVEMGRDEHELNALEMDARALVIRIDVVKEMVANRARLAKEIDTILVRRHGKPNERKPRLEREDDVKSSMVVDYIFGSRRVSVRVTLAGAVEVTGSSVDPHVIQEKVAAVEKQKLLQHCNTVHGKAQKVGLLISPQDSELHTLGAHRPVKHGVE